MSKTTTVTFEDVRKAADRIASSVIHTPFIHSQTLSEIAGAEIWIKLENLQFTASFKERGAANKLSTLSAAEAKRGVIAMSAGNHAQAVAYHAQRLGISATIVMPKSTPFVKVSRTRHHGARVLLEGETLADAAAFAHALAAKENLIFVHPYDDAAVIAGQGTVALEMLGERPALDCIVVPVGGGGLAAGAAVAADGLGRPTKIVGVEVESYAAAAQTLAGAAISVGGATIAEGIAVRDVGALPMSMLRAHGVDVVTVSERQIERAVILLVEIEKTVAEGAGAAPLAAVLAHRDRFAGKRVGLVISGGNIDTRILANVLMRGLVRDGRLIRLTVEVQDRPGALAKITESVARTGGNIVEVQHQRFFGVLSANIAEIELLIEAQDARHADAIVEDLRAGGAHVRQREFAADVPVLDTLA
ncbi:threonine ammonia-lyase [Bradyrhizobium sp. LHD-71]|uniref:threonine ammonia-lyase n=1 Tax=Bradyrhizobium sp. LHD-71 TaxID=3072141 RepID=UPI0028104E8E|nr:threonine ammonia-lyase [Bradyrhizobium sp. LHD-71]MDQ8729991.1 threonine ammonia-lyase [Bradyrhizobium sp. LHD-71]